MVLQGQKRGSYIKDDVPGTVRQRNKRLEDSAEAWKEKNREKAERIKALTTRCLEARESRERWKSMAETIPAYQETIEALEIELARAKIEVELRQAELDDLKKKHRESRFLL